MKLTPNQIEKLNKHIEDGYIRFQTNETGDLFIYNYTDKTQYEQNWDEMTLMCRGLILDKDYNIIARSFDKFFNYEELVNKGKDIPNLPYEISSKLDGSMIIAFYWKMQWCTATRGSFNSDQAKKAESLFFEKYVYNLFKMDPSKSYIYEILYPENRVVCNYGDKEELVLLTIIDPETGKDCLDDRNLSFKRPKVYNNYDYTTIRDEIDGTNDEGFVVKFSNGFRMKIKYAEYCRLHKLMCGINERRLWELLSNNESIDYILENVPDEFYDWVKKVIKDLNDKYKRIELFTHKIFWDISDWPNSTRKDKALYIMKYHKEFSSIIFKMMDGQEYDMLIWKLIKPKAEKPFHQRNLDTE